ncbi:serine hydrolase domain-containing protein [Hymenobacter metallilatus]|uniref:Class A beta-lactamase-related serine hydrolase n=1 Tax=Hymenobacter metallilatus TaxID=2493666 RepID=A0A428JT42_9BACT|nr:serine hydrolase domain-containing protein [Hymenobacter metallilatus]RSK37305.1 class A beta-lactamase-related serine hydrolase [Hymenobacter metallilatus]
MLRTSFILLPVLLAGTALAQTAVPPAASTTAPAVSGALFNQAKLDSLFTALESNHKLMGSLVLSRGGKVVYSRAIGLEQPGIPATTATRYRVGSISKTFTATLVMQLVEEGQLRLDAPIATWFPMLPNATKLTVDQLLHHRSGLHNFTNDPTYRQYMTQPKTQAEMLAIMARPAVDFEPGAKYAYSNTNYVLLGYLIEKVTKQPYAKVLQQRITGKLKLKDTYYGGRIGSQPHEAASFTWSGTAWQPEPETDMSIPGGAGAIVSTPADLARFMEGLYGGKLVKPATLQQMLTMQDTYGVGLMQMPFYGKQSFGHGGAIDAFRSMVGYFPAEQLTVAYCTNGSTYSPNDMVIGALSSYFGRPYRLPDFTTSAVTLTAAELAPYLGTYASSQLPLKISVTANGTTLLAQATGQNALPLTAKTNTQFVYEGAGIIMDFDAARHTFTLRQGGGTYLFTRE